MATTRQKNPPPALPFEAILGLFLDDELSWERPDIVWDIVWDDLIRLTSGSGVLYAHFQTNPNGDLARNNWGFLTKVPKLWTIEPAQMWP